MIGTWRRVGIFALFEVPALDPLPGIVESIQIGGRGIIKGLKSNPQPCFIHHVKHDLHPLAFFSEKQSPAFAFAAQGHGAGGAGMNPHFFFDARANHIIGFSQASVFVDPYFGNNENGNPFGSRRIAFNPCQNRVNDIFRQIILSVGDKDFVAGDGIGAVGILDGSGRQRTDIRTGLGFGQQHGAAPFGGI